MVRDLICIGPFTIRSFGVAIIVGLLIFMRLMQRHPSFKKLGLQNVFVDVMLVGIASALLGGRLMHALTEPELFADPMRLFAFWEGGLAIIGGVVGVLIAVPCYLRWKGVPIVPFLDLAALHIPLLHGISRIGCFLAGCCYGRVSTVAWAITYTGTNTEAPINVPLHPTQLYSAGILILIFLFMYTVVQHRVTKPGQLLCTYLILTNLERFFVDFFRDDRIYVTSGVAHLSLYQIIAAYIIVVAAIVLLRLSWQPASKQAT